MTDSFVTQCPHCRTSFRVSHANLTVARGAVRCGACLQVFNAAQQLLEQKTGATQATQIAPPPPLSSSINEGPAATSQPQPIIIEQRVNPDQPIKSPSLAQNPPDPMWIHDDLDLDNLDLDEELAKLEQQELQISQRLLAQHDRRPFAAHVEEEDESWALALLDEDEAADLTDNEIETSGRTQKTSGSQIRPVNLERRSKPRHTEHIPRMRMEPTLELPKSTSEPAAFQPVAAQSATPELATSQPATPEPAAPEPATPMPAAPHSAQSTPEIEPERLSAAKPAAVVPSDDQTETEGSFSVGAVLNRAAEQKEQAKRDQERQLAEAEEDSAPPAEVFQPHLQPEPEPQAGRTTPNSPDDLVTKDAKDEQLLNLYDDTLLLEWQEEKKSPWNKRVLWGVLVFVAVSGLLVQYLCYHFEEMARQDRYRPWFQSICPTLGCALPSKVDIDMIRSSNLVVRTHPEFAGALMVDAILYNRAAFSQPFPLLELRFVDAQGNIVASRRFTPTEYLSGELAGQDEMPQQTPIHISLDILDPGKKAVNYSLNFYSPD